MTAYGLSIAVRRNEAVVATFDTAQNLVIHNLHDLGERDSVAKALRRAADVLEQADVAAQ